MLISYIKGFNSLFTCTSEVNERGYMKLCLLHCLTIYKIHGIHGIQAIHTIHAIHVIHCASGYHRVEKKINKC